MFVHHVLNGYYILATGFGAHELAIFREYSTWIKIMAVSLSILLQKFYV